MPTIKIYHPFRNVNQNLKGLIAILSDLTEEVLGIETEEIYVGEGFSEMVKLLKNEKSAAGFVSDYEAIYLETFYDYVPIMRFKVAKLDKVIVVNRNAGYNRISDLKGKTIGIQSGKELQIVNPVVSFFIKNCSVFNEYPQMFFPLSGYSLIDGLFENVMDAVLILDNVYNSLGENQKKELKTLGKFSCIPGFALAMSANVGEKIRDALIGKEEVIEKFRSVCTSYDFEFEPSFDIDRSLVIEAVEGQGVSFKDYVENPESITWTIADSVDSWRIKELKERVYNLTRFNEKLVEMYKSVKQSRDELSSLIDSPVEKIILFSKEGRVYGVSRSFLKELKYTRKELIGKKIHSFLYSQDNIPIDTLIDKIDYGLIRSCRMRIKKRGVAYADIKMNFSVIELDNKKLILGVVI